MYIADLHIHSRYSRATSRDLTPEQLDFQARKKGIRLLVHRHRSDSGISPLAAFFLSSAMRVGPGNIIWEPEILLIRLGERS